MKSTNKMTLTEIADKIRQTHSAYWMGNDAEELAQMVEEGSLEYLQRLRKIQRVTGNFVRIVTGRDIPVTYSSGAQSYTTGKHVVLSADVDPLKIDSLVGLALHESAHCLLSNESLDFIPGMHQTFEQLVRGRPILASSWKLGIPLTSTSIGNTFSFKPGDTVIEHVQMVMNVLEDRRIDLWMYTNAPGYRPYYDSLYNLYWHSDTIDKALQDPATWDRSVESYIMFIINMTNEHYNESAMPGLDEIYRIANLTVKGVMERGDEDKGWMNWRSVLSKSGPLDYDKMPKLFADAVRIMEVVYEHALTVESLTKKEREKKEGELGQPGDLPNMDTGPSLSEKQRDEIRKAIARQKKFLSGDHEKKTIDAFSAEELDNLNKTNAKVTTVEGDFLPRGVKAKVVIYRDITKEIAQSPAFPFSTATAIGGRARPNPYMVQAVSDGLRMGQILGNRIQVMQDERPLVFNRQQHGKMDKRRIAGLGHDVSDIFAFTVTEKKQPANLWMDIDFSGSMDKLASGRAMAVAIAIAKAAEMTRTLNCTIAIRDGSDHVRVAILYDSRKHSFVQLKSIVPYLTVSGGTPESLAFEAVKDEMLAMYGDERKYFINLSDGEPMHNFRHEDRLYKYGGDNAYTHTRRLMKEFRQAGISVMSYYIGQKNYEHPGFKQMYGNDARFIDVTQVSDIVRTLNKLLMSE